MYSFREFLLNEEMTNAQLVKIYNEINRVAFNSELPNIFPKVSKRLSRATGITTAKVKDNKLIGQIEVKISDKYVMDNDTITMVLAHEMIHVWFFHNGDFKESHGIAFKRKAKEIGSILNIDIPITHDTKNLKIAREPKRVVGVFIRGSGKNIIAFFNYTSYLKNRMYFDLFVDAISARLNFDVEEVRVIVDKTHVAEKYPLQRVSRKFPKLYRADASDIKELLSLETVKVLGPS